LKLFLTCSAGAGLGGPARCISKCTGAKVIGVELQSDLTILANEMCKKCDLHNDVKVINGDILDFNLVLDAEGHFDAAMSWLVILHIPLNQRQLLFSRIYDMLKPGGMVYIEDFFLRVDGGDWTEREVHLLSSEVYVPDAGLPTKEDYVKTVHDVGFTAQFEDVTEEWTVFTAQRLGQWREQRDRHERVQNVDTWQSLDRFYSAMVELFEGGRLGGVKLILKKPLSI
jgi:cyclopropane fatty-acyl-phospholipid synthase-like methyltransferase